MNDSRQTAAAGSATPVTEPEPFFSRTHSAYLGAILRRADAVRDWFRKGGAVFGVLLALLTVTVLTLGVERMQQFLYESSTITDDSPYERPYGIAFVLVIAAMTFWGGLRFGIITTIFAVAATALYLLPANHDPGNLRPKDAVEVAFLVAGSSVIIWAIHGAQMQRELVRQALWESEEARLRLRAITDTAPVALVTCDAQGVLDFANPEAERIWGQSLLKISKEGWTRYGMHTPEGEPVPPEQTGLARALAGDGDEKGMVATDVVIRRPDGNEVWVTSRSKAIRRDSTSAGLLGAVVAFVDVTRQREIEAERERLLNTLLLHCDEVIPGLDLALHYSVAQKEVHVGGDFYDVYRLSDNRTALVMGDMSGKGVPAAAQVTMVRYMLRHALYNGQGVGEAFRNLNNTLCDRKLLHGFVTLFAVIFDSDTGTLTYASSGHEPGLLRRRANSEVTELDPTGPVLGAFDGADFQEVKLSLSEGDIFVLYTDGVSEAGRDSHDFLGTNRLSQFVQEVPNELPAQGVLRSLLQKVEAHAPDSQHDDRCLLVAVACPGKNVQADCAVPMVAPTGTL
ncbi:MAG: hypothetical protein OHK0029_38810 [Armatimonadaceae bacterium]